MDKLSCIQVFLNVVECGSFSAASERLGLSRAAVSKYVAELESQLGGRLLNRTTRHVSMTESGRNYYERCKDILVSLEEADEMVAGMRLHARGSLRISAPTNFASRQLVPLISDFHQRYPEVQVELICNDRIIDLVDEGYDLAIRITDKPGPDLVARRLCSCHHALVASPAYLAEYGAPTTPGELIRYPTLLFVYLAGGIWPLYKDGRQYPIKVNPILRSNNPDVLLEAAIRGMGLALLPTFVVSEALAEGALSQVLTSYQSLNPGIYAVYATQRHLPVKIQLFVDFLRDRLADPPYWDSAGWEVSAH